MKFYPLTALQGEQAVLDKEYASGREIGGVTLGGEYLFFKEKRKVHYVPYSQVTRAFRRVQLVQTKMCCGKGNLQVENLVVCGADGAELAQIQLPGERAGKIMLEELASRAPHIQIGKPKENIPVNTGENA